MDFNLKFGENLNPRFFNCRKNRVTVCENIVTDSLVTATEGGVKASLEYLPDQNGFCYKIKVSNDSENDFLPETFGVDLGIDTYLECYPEWNEKFFPTHFRCEKSHFWGYFMGPTGRIIGVFTNAPIASYHFDYNGNAGGWGHRINFAGLSLFNAEPLPEHHPKNLGGLKSGNRQRSKFTSNTAKIFPILKR